MIALGSRFRGLCGLRSLGGLLLRSPGFPSDRDPVDLCFDAVFEQKRSCFIVDAARQLLPKPNFEMCCSSSCSLGVAEDHRSLHSLGAVHGLPNVADRNKSVCIPCKDRVLASVGTLCLHAFF